MDNIICELETMDEVKKIIAELPEGVMLEISVKKEEETE